MGIEFNKNVVKIAPKRIGAPLSWLNDPLEENSEKMKDFLNKVLPTKTKIISINDTITVNGVSYTNESSSYPAFVIDFDVSDHTLPANSTKFSRNQYFGVASNYNIHFTPDLRRGSRRTTI